VLITDILKN